MIKKNLVVSLDATDGFEKDVMAVKTTSNPDIIVLEMAGPKVAISPKELEQAIVEIHKFLEERSKSTSVLREVESIEVPVINEIVYGDDEASNS